MTLTPKKCGTCSIHTIFKSFRNSFSFARIIRLIEQGAFRMPASLWSFICYEFSRFKDEDGLVAENWSIRNLPLLYSTKLLCLEFAQKTRSNNGQTFSRSISLSLLPLTECSPAPFRAIAISKLGLGLAK